jgi:hypothetical protein
MCRFSEDHCDAYWLRLLQKILLATIPATGIFLVKDLLLEVIIIRQTSRMVDTKKDVILRQAKAFQLVMSTFTGEGNRSFPDQLKLLLQKIKSIFPLELRSVLLRARSPAANDYNAKFNRYMSGNDRDEVFDVDGKTLVEQMRDQCRENYKMILTDEEDGTINEDINKEFFEEWLNSPDIKRINNSSDMGGNPLTAEDMLKMLDKDGNDTIGLEEWVEANVETIMAFRDIEKSVKGIRRAAKSVDVVFSCMLLCFVAILYGKIPLQIHTLSNC